MPFVESGAFRGEGTRVAAVNTLKTVIYDLLAEQLKNAHEKMNVRKDLESILDLSLLSASAVEARTRAAYPHDIENMPDR